MDYCYYCNMLLKKKSDFRIILMAVIRNHKKNHRNI